MDTTQFASYCHEAIHELIDLNAKCEEEFGISSWPRYNCEFEKSTLTFSQEAIPKVVALIHVVGTTSTTSNTWLWSWANEYLPEIVRKPLAKVREFGETENLSDLIRSKIPDEEELGWRMTAIAAKVLGAKGGYRCPSENGFIYLIYLSLRHVDEENSLDETPGAVQCEEHMAGFETFACAHLVSNPEQEWFSREPSESNPWPDAWCGICDTYFQEEGEWNDNNSSKLKIKLLCHRCYEKFRAREQSNVDQT